VDNGKTYRRKRRPTVDMPGSESISTKFNREELFQILQELIQINSENPPGKEEAVAKLVQHILQKNDIPAELSWAGPARPNVIARLKGRADGPKMIFNGHLDTVPSGQGWTKDPFSGTIMDGKIFGRGAADMKSGVASMMYSAIVLKRMGAPFSGELILFFDVDEELQNAGMKKFLTENISADYAVIGEPTSLDICTGHRGCSRYRLKTYGTPGHTSFVINPDNAIYKMAKLVVALETLAADIYGRIDPRMGNASLTVSQIQGGTGVNIVPSLCEIFIDRRSFPGETYEDLLREIDTCIAKAAEPLNLTYDLECYQFVPATVIGSDDPFVLRLLSAAAKVRGKEPPVRIFEATCEAPFLSIDKGIATIIFGPGSITQAHVIDEYVELDEVEKAALIYIYLALDMLKGE
jgi:succinyl-diaminopimelate desuccinylase